MLVEFKVSNYRSIGEEQILSLVPAKKTGDNIISCGKHRALNAVAIYGANASGKSNLLLSMSLLDKLIHSSAQSSSTAKLPYDPFLLRKGWNEKPTKFEITFIVNTKKYRYGLEFHQNKIASEWLYRKSVGREVYVFVRENDVIDVSSGFEGNKALINLAIEATRDNALFLSTCDMFNIAEAKTIFQWFKSFQMIDGINTKTIETLTLWDNKGYQQQINNYMTQLGFGLMEVGIAAKDLDRLGDIRPESQNTKKKRDKKKIFAKHKIYSPEGEPTEELLSWEFEERESAGTNKAFHLSGPILWTLTNGGVLIIDEIEAKIHPIMTIEIINLFFDEKTNPNKAQLIFATHDTNLLSYINLRRDQIYFSEKNNWESTEIYSLSDFNYLNNTTERPDKDKEKRYFEGRYGAIPILANFHALNLLENGKEG